MNKSSTTTQQLYATMLSSATAGMIARVPMHPVDTCKAKLQVIVSNNSSSNKNSSVVYRHVLQCLTHTFRTEGIRGLYPGFGITFIGSAPAACLYFTSYETAKSFYRPFAERTPFIADFFSGLTAECLSCVIWVPIDVIKERLQVQSQLPANVPRYKGNIDALITISQKEGIRGLYKGYGATVASFGPFSAFYLMFYEQFKLWSMKWLQVQKELDLPFMWSMFNGAAAGGLASFVTNPVDLAKLRIQVQRGRDLGPHFNFNYRNVFHGMKEIARQEGLRALWKGAGARMAFHAPSTAITIAAYEECKKLFFPYFAAQ